MAFWSGTEFLDWFVRLLLKGVLVDLGVSRGTTVPRMPVWILYAATSTCVKTRAVEQSWRVSSGNDIVFHPYITIVKHSKE